MNLVNQAVRFKGLILHSDSIRLRHLEQVQSKENVRSLDGKITENIRKIRNAY
jgi:hypothetical protein